MKTLYKCAVCGFTSEKQDDVLRCEALCQLANQLDEIFSDPSWNPPLPLKRFKEWTNGDRQAMAQKIEWFFDRHFR